MSSMFIIFVHPFNICIVWRVELIHPGKCPSICILFDPLDGFPCLLCRIKTIEAIDPKQQILSSERLDIFVDLRLWQTQGQHLHLKALGIFQLLSFWQHPASTTLIFSVPFVWIPVCLGRPVRAIFHLVPLGALSPLCFGKWRKAWPSPSLVVMCIPWMTTIVFRAFTPIVVREINIGHVGTSIP